MRVSIGESVAVPCEVSDGPFPGEKLVTIDTIDGPMSGFVDDTLIETLRDGRSSLVGQIKEIHGNVFTVLLKGSFFTSTGLAYMAEENVKAVHM